MTPLDLTSVSQLPRTGLACSRRSVLFQSVEKGPSPDHSDFPGQDLCPPLPRNLCSKHCTWPDQEEGGLAVLATGVLLAVALPPSQPDWAILPLWGRILFRFHSRVVSKVGGSSVCMCWGMGSKENGGWAGLSGSQPRW